MASDKSATSGGGLHSKFGLHSGSAFVAAALITIGAIVVAVAHVIWPDLEIDNITLALIGIAVLPWLGQIIKNFEIAGVFKAEYQDIVERIEQNRNAIEDVRGESASAKTMATEAIGGLVAPSSESQSRVATDELTALINEYDRIRGSDSSGDARTARMTGVVGRMLPLVSTMPEDPAGANFFKTGGERLAAYARIYANPEIVQGIPELIEALVRSVSEEEPDRPGRFMAQPFEQYWGLQALAKVAARFPELFTHSIHQQLVQLLRRLKRGIDRHYVLSSLLRGLGVQDEQD